MTRYRLNTILIAGLFVTAVTGRATTISTTNLLSNPGAETGNITGWTVGGTSSPTTDFGLTDLGINPRTGTYDFFGGNGASGTLTQTISIIGLQGITTAAVNSGNLSANLSFWEQGLAQGNPSDNAQIILSFYGAGTTLLDTESTAFVDSHGNSWTQGTASFAIPAQTVSIAYTMNFVRHQGNSLDAFIDDNNLTVAGTFVSAVPEPGSAALLGAGVAVFLLIAYRKSRREGVPLIHPNS